MTKLTLYKTTFTAGEVSPDLLGRGDLRAYENGALQLRNVFIQPTGGVTRRCGLRYVDTALGNGRLLAFEFNTEQTYLLVLTALRIDIYEEGVPVAFVASPWGTEHISQVSWTQSADTLLFMHPDFPSRRLTRSASGTWTLASWEFYSKNDVVHQPYFKFAESRVTLTPSGTSGTITLTASEAVFSAAHEGTRLRVGNKEVLITAFNSPTVVTATVIETLLSLSATVDWEEQAFSPVRGYPVSAAYHQDRLVIGGSRDLPNRLWMSQSGDLMNFNLGTGLDSEAIEFGIFSDQINAIRGVFSGRHLQVFTSGAEWMVTGDPLTPANVQIKRQTRIGSPIHRYIPPLDVDGATLFVARNGQELREFIYTDVEQAYRATDLALLSRHIITTPIDQDFDQKRRLLFLVRQDGKFATLTVYRAEDVAAWTLHETSGLVKSVSVVGESVYLLVERDGAFQIEEIDESLYLDSALRGTSPTAVSTWGGLDHLEGKSVSIVADGQVQSNQTVSGGEIVLEEPAREVVAGLGYHHVIEPLPPSLMTGVGGGRSLRLVEACFRLKDSSALQLDSGRGLRDVALRSFGAEEILDAPPPLVSADVRVRAFGWQNDFSKPLWRIEQNLPLPFTLLSVGIEIKVNQ
jgi:hypothetical protein